MSGINMVKFFFLKGTMPRSQSEIQRVTTLAYQTAREHSLYPKQILIRCVDSLLLRCNRPAYRFVPSKVDRVIPQQPLGANINPTLAATTLPSVTRASNKSKPKPTSLVMAIHQALQITSSQKRLSQERNLTLRRRGGTTSLYGQL